MINVSVILPTYNNGTTIKLFLDSLAEQSLASCVDFIVHDDNSTDDTVQIIKSHPVNFVCNSVRIIERDSNYYMKNRNWSFLYEVLLSSLNEVVFFAEADDLWLDNMKIEMQLDDLRVNNTWFSWHHYHLLTEKDFTIDKWNAVVLSHSLSLPDVIFGGGGTIRYSSFAINLRLAPTELLAMCFRMEVIDLFLQFICVSNERTVIPSNTVGVSLTRSRESWTEFSRQRKNQLEFRKRLYKSIERELDILSELRGFRFFVIKYLIENVKLCVRNPWDSWELGMPTIKAALLLFR